jgi:hypothetical protein
MRGLCLKRMHEFDGRSGEWYVTIEANRWSTIYQVNE